MSRTSTLSPTALTANGCSPPATTAPPGSGTPTPASRSTLLEGQVGQVWGPSISGDGRLFAASWPDEGVTRVADMATGRVVREIRAVPHPMDTAFSPDGALIAVRSPDYSFTSVKVFDVDTGAETLDLPHASPVHDVAWSPDGALIATAAEGACADLGRLDRPAADRAARPPERGRVHRLEPRPVRPRDGERRRDRQDVAAGGGRRPPAVGAHGARHALRDLRASRSRRTGSAC